MVEPEPGREKPLRLGVGHLLLWTTATAIVAAVRSAWTDWDSFEPHTRNVVRIGHVPVAMVYGAALAVAWIFLSARLRGRTNFPSAPGHWLLLFLASAMAIDGVVSAVEIYDTRVLGPELSDREKQLFWHLRQFAMFFGGYVSCLLFTILTRHERRWLILYLFPASMLWVLLIIHGAILGRWLIFTPFWWAGLQWVQIVGAGSLALLGAAMAVYDLRRGPPRDWLHWTGLAAFFIGSCMFCGDRAYWLVQNWG